MPGGLIPARFVLGDGFDYVGVRPAEAWAADQERIIGWVELAEPITSGWAATPALGFKFSDLALK
jgi:hypothetical protein